MVGCRFALASPAGGYSCPPLTSAGCANDIETGRTRRKEAGQLPSNLSVCLCQSYQAVRLPCRSLLRGWRCDLSLCLSLYHTEPRRPPIPSGPKTSVYHDPQCLPMLTISLSLSILVPHLSPTPHLPLASRCGFGALLRVPARHRASSVMTSCGGGPYHPWAHNCHW
jgi:hypothetical protein